MEPIVAYAIVAFVAFPMVCALVGYDLFWMWRLRKKGSHRGTKFDYTCKRRYDK